MSNYPAGAEYDENAPYNEGETPDEIRYATFRQTLAKDVELHNDEYYSDNYYTALELLEKFQKLLYKLKSTESDPRTLKFYNNLFEQCDNWIEEDYGIY